jgi:hypothetical protein
VLKWLNPDQWFNRYWDAKRAVQFHMRKNKRLQNKVEPEFDCEYGGGQADWPWVENGGPVIDPDDPTCIGWETPYLSLSDNAAIDSD